MRADGQSSLPLLPGLSTNGIRSVYYRIPKSAWAPVVLTFLDILPPLTGRFRTSDVDSQIRKTLNYRTQRVLGNQPVMSLRVITSVVVEAIRGHTAYGLVAKRHEIVWPGLSVRKRGHTHVWLG